jgi:hypothetical protein
LSFEALKSSKKVWFADDDQTKEAPTVSCETTFHEKMVHSFFRLKRAAAPNDHSNLFSLPLSVEAFHQFQLLTISSSSKLQAQMFGLTFGALLHSLPKRHIGTYLEMHKHIHFLNGSGTPPVNTNIKFSFGS